MLDLEKMAEDVSRGWGLPANLYRNEDWFQIEKRAIFAKTWYYVGTTHRLKTEGDRFVAYAGDTPVVVTLNGNGELNALVNVCRHRGHPVCLQDGNSRTLTCRYHSWSYGLDGQLRGAPGSADEVDFDKRDFGLTRLPVYQWGPVIFVASSPDAKPFSEHFPDFERIAGLRNYDLDPSSYSLHRSSSATVNANWKIWYDNSGECFHCSTIHSSSFNDAYGVDNDNFETIVEDRIISYNYPPAPNVAKSNVLKMTWNKHMHLFPGCFVLQQDDMMICHQMRPLSSGQTRMIWEIFGHKDADPERVEGWARIWEETLMEDKQVVEAVFENISEDTFTANRYMSSQEPMLININRWIIDLCRAEATA